MPNEKEKTHILNFIDEISEQDFASARASLVAIVNEKITSKISEIMRESDEC